MPVSCSYNANREEKKLFKVLLLTLQQKTWQVFGCASRTSSNLVFS